MIHRISSFFFSLMLIFIFSSCASDKGVAVERNGLIGESYEAKASSETALEIPELVKPTNDLLSGLDPEIVKNVENGSLPSLKSAVSKLRKADMRYTNQEAILFFTATNMISILWPDELINWAVPDVLPDNPYVAAIQSARKGVYDFSAAQTDCLSCALPSLVLLTVPSVQNYYEEAEAALKKGLEFCSDSVFTRYLLSLLYNRQKRYSESAKTMKSVFLAQGVQSLQLTLVYVEALLYSGDIIEADKICTSAMNIYSDSTPLLKLAAEISFSLKNFQAADQYIVQVLQREPDNSEFVLFRVRVLMAKEEYIKVSSLLDLYARVEKTSKQYLLLRSQLQQDWNKNTVAAAATLQEALTRYPDDLEVLLAAASLSAKTDQKINNITAIEMIQNILEKEPENPEAILLFVSEQIKLKNWQSAYTFSKKLIADKIPTIEMSIPHIEICLGLHYLKEAREILDKLKASSANSEAVVLEEIRVLIAENKKQEAVNIIERQLEKVNPREKSALYYEYSRLAANEDERLSLLRASLTSNPRNHEALFDLYLLYFKRNDYRKAQYYLKQVVALNPNNQDLLKLNSELENLLSR